MTTPRWDTPPEKLSAQDIRSPDWRIQRILLHDSLGVMTCARSPARLAMVSEIATLQTKGRANPFGERARAQEVLVLTGSPIPESVHPSMEVAGADPGLVITKRLTQLFDLEKDLPVLRDFLESSEGDEVGLVIVDGITWGEPRKLRESSRISGRPSTPWNVPWPT